jgi:hypothetical protein
MDDDRGEPVTVYDFTQALARYRWVVISSLVALIAIVGFMSFTFDNGKLGWRLGPSYESSAQIAVVDPSINRLSSTSPTAANLQAAAALYAAILGTDEAALFVGEQNGYELAEAIDARVDSNAPLIEVTVEGPTPEQAAGAALSTFDYLEGKLQTPLTRADFPAPPTTVVTLDGPFESYLALDVDAALDTLPDDLFLVVESAPEVSTTLPLSVTAGQTVPWRSTLSPVMTLALTLQNGKDEILDVARVAAPALTENVVTEYPRLVLTLDPESVRQVEGDWRLNVNRMRVRWSPGTEAIAADDIVEEDVQIALLTPEPGAISVGGRRGPIILVAALIVGIILLLSGVIVADTWRSEREKQQDAIDEERVPPTIAPVLTAAGLDQEDEEDDGEADSDEEADERDDPSQIQPWHWRKQA